MIPFTGTWVLDPLPKNPDGGAAAGAGAGQRLITLTTCAEIFHTDDRMIAFGHLVSSRPKTDNLARMVADPIDLARDSTPAAD